MDLPYFHRNELHGFALRSALRLALLTGFGCVAESGDGAAGESEPGAIGSSIQDRDSDGGQSDGGQSDGGPSDGGQDKPVADAPPSAEAVAWWSYERPEQYTSVATKLKVPMRDGEELGCRLARPGTGEVPAAGRFPGLIVEFGPYWLVGDLAFAPTADFYTKRGYNTLVCTLRGVGESSSTWQGTTSATAWRDAHDLIEWLASQPFSTENIGQVGTSYGGFTSWGAAIEQPPHLRAIAPLQAPASMYHDVNYPGGIETTRSGTINSWPDSATVFSGFAFSADDEYAIWHAHQSFDAYWQERAFASHYDRVQVPVLAVGGWKDGFFREGSLRNFENTADRTWLIYGQWSHIGASDDSSCEDKCNLSSLMQNVTLAWFDRWLLDLPDSPVPEQPSVLSYEGPVGNSKGWRQLSNWNSNGSPGLEYQLAARGALQVSSTPVELGAKFHEPGDETDFGATLTFTAPRLPQDFVLAGYPVLRIRAALSAPDANFYVQLIDVAPNGSEQLVNDGFLKASHRTSHTNPTPVTLREVNDYEIKIRPQHFRFKAGHRIRLRVWGGNADTLVPSGKVDVTVQHGSVILPRLAGP